MPDYQSIFMQAWQLRKNEDYQAIADLISQHLPEAEADHNLEGLSYLLKIKAQVASDQDLHDEALSTYKRLERVFIDLEDEVKQMHTLRHIGQSFLALGKADCAEKCLGKVVEANQRLNSNDLEKANTHYAFAEALIGMSKTNEAKEHLSIARDLYEELDIHEGVQDLKDKLAKL